MTLSVYAVHDVKAASFATPFFVANEALARRAFIDLCRDSRTTVAQHPEDFALFFMGFFEPENGEFYRNPGESQPVQILTGLEARVAALKCDKQAAELHGLAEDPAS